jgi:hypothetical protein
MTTNGFEDRVLKLLDKQAIYENILRYCRGVDHRDGDLIRSSYHPDAHDDHGTFIGGTEELVRQNATEPAGQTTLAASHMVGNCLIDLDGDEAKAETYFLMHKRVLLDDVEYVRVRAGRYLDVLTRTDGEWRIWRRVVVDDWNRTDPLATEQVGHTRGAVSLEDPVYGFLSSEPDVPETPSSR